MDSLETFLYFFFDAYFRRAPSKTVVGLRLLALVSVIAGATCFAFAFMATAAAQSRLVIAGTLCLVALALLTFVCAGMVGWSKRNE